MPAKRDDAVALGKVIEARRDDMGYSRPEMAKVAGISYPNAYEIERGSKYPSAAALEKIAAALEVPAQELLSEAATRLVSPAVVAEFTELVRRAARPIDDHRSTADHRRHSVGVLAGRLLRRAFPNE